jgi:hypothetical protein
MAGRWRDWVRFGLPGVALGLLMSWGSGFHGEPSTARAQDVTARAGAGAPASGRPMAAPAPQAARGVTSAESGGILAMVSNTSAAAGVQWLYLIDTKKRAFAIYRVDSMNSQGCVKLEAARQFRWDLDLDEYNNQGLEPADVKARVDAVNRSNP